MFNKKDIHRCIPIPDRPTPFFSDVVALFNDFFIKLSIGGEGDVFLLHGGVYDELFSFLDLISMQGNREGK